MKKITVTLNLTSKDYFKLEEVTSHQGYHDICDGVAVLIDELMNKFDIDLENSEENSSSIEVN